MVVTGYDSNYIYLSDPDPDFGKRKMTINDFVAELIFVLNSAYIKLDRKMKNKKVAALLSLLFPGFGHLYIGKYVDAVVFIAGAGVLWYTLFLKGYYLMMSANPRYYLVLAALIFVYLFSTFDAYRKTK